MYPASRAKRAEMETRRTHKMLPNSPLGSMADLHDSLMKEGFGYQYKAGQKSYFETGIAPYLNLRSGEKALLMRVQKGQPAMWTGAKVGLVRTAQQPDVWQLIRKRRRQ